MNLQLLLLGTPLLLLDGREIALECERRTQMLAYLAWKGTWVGRAELAALLWPELPRKLAFTNLRKALHRLQTFAPVSEAGPLLEMNGSALRCTHPTDCNQFLEAATAGDHTRALALWRGEFLSGFDVADNQAWAEWLEFERTRLRSLWRAAVQAALRTAQDPVAAVELALRLHEDDRFDEDALRLALHWLARSGQKNRVQPLYLEFAAVLRRELAIEPSAGLVAYVDELLNSPATQSATPNLEVWSGASRAEPVAAGFVGRANEVRRIASLLEQPDCRLLSLTGVGGVGKTRLAQEIMRQLGGQFESGAALIQLEDIADPALLADRIARDISLSVRPGSTTLDQLCVALKDSPRLLVLDNFEQLLGAADQVQQLIEACPSLRILVTSRTRLGIAAEWLFPLEGLPSPEPEDQDQFEAFDAPRLFIRAARRMRPDFDVKEERDALIELCRQVAGLPLALELAASWTRVLSCAEIVHELMRSNELLSAVDASRPDRHASLEAVFNHSWSLLSTAEREVLARLSVFAGSFTTNAARAVAGAQLPVLRALADKSLLRREGVRLSLHPLVQQLSRIRLAQAGWQASAEAAHAAWFHHLLHRLRPGVAGASGEALSAVAADFENIRLAWRHAIVHGQGAQLLRSLPALESYFEERARFSEGIALLGQALASPTIAADDTWAGTLTAEFAAQNYRLGRYDEASRLAGEALARLSAPGTDLARYRANWVLGACCLQTGDVKRGRDLIRQARRHAQAADSPDAENACIANLALAEKRLGNYDACLTLTLEAVARHRIQGQPGRVALGLCNLGSLYLFLDKLEQGHAALQEALQLSDAHDLVSTRAYVQANLAEWALKRQRDDLALLHVREALKSAEAFGLRVLAGWLKAQLARLTGRQGAVSEARQWLRESAVLALDVAAASVKAALVQSLGEHLHAAGHAQAALRILAFARHDSQLSAPDREEIAALLRRLGSQDDAPKPWPALTLDGLLERVVLEAPEGFSRLVADIESA